MTPSSRESRIFVHLSRPLMATAIACGFLTTAPLFDCAMHPAAAQVTIRADFRVALEPYGQWQRIARWGDVWVPSDRPRGWRPYTLGRWVYSDDWGWYWASDQDEDAWGWVVYHYGRWVLDADFGWVWVPGDEWGPGFVQWRRGTQYVGWAPLPPDERIEFDYRDQPDVWAFVRIRDFTAPRIATVILPEREYVNVVRETVVVNRTVEFRDRRFAVNPGIEPAIVAAAVGRPIRSFEVHPRVFAGTARIPGAVEVRADELRSRDRLRENFRASLRETSREIAPAARVSQPQPLGRTTQGRLGETPPRAAGPAAQPGATQGRGNPQPPLQPGTQGRNPQQPPQPGTQGRGNPQQPLQPSTQGRGNPQQPLQPGTQGRGNPQQPLQPGTQGRGNPQQPLQPGTQGRNPQQPLQPGMQGRNPQPQPGTQGLGTRNQPQQGPQPQQAPQPRGERQPQVEPPRTQGLAPRREQQPQGTAPQPQQRPPQVQQPQAQPPRTQGLAPRNEPQQGPRPQEQRQPQAQPRTQGLAPSQQPRPQAPLEQRPPQQSPRAQEPPRQPQIQPPREQPRTEGMGAPRGGPAPGAAPPQQAAPRPGGPPAANEGRGGPRRDQRQ